MTEILDDRRELELFLLCHDYQTALERVRDILRRHLIKILGKNWEDIHTRHGMYTINCRAKRIERTLAKYDGLLRTGESITSKNFFRYMPDLVGARLVVVDPGDLFPLAELVRNGCMPSAFEPAGVAFEHPIRARHGKFSMYDADSFAQAGYHLEEEHTGYCSVHFVFRTGPTFFSSECYSEELQCLERLADSGRIPMDEWRVEIQVRTLMDEAWGETDHFVRYEDPALRDDPAITSHFTALAGYLQAANFHVSLIREMAKNHISKRRIPT